MKTKRHLKVLSILLTVVLIICSVPAFSVSSAAATVKSGTCGTNLTWTLDSNGTLTISGTGNMKD